MSAMKRLFENDMVENSIPELLNMGYSKETIESYHDRVLYLAGFSNSIIENKFNKERLV